MRRTWVHDVPGVPIALSLLIALTPVSYAHALSHAVDGEVHGSVVAAETGMPLAGVVVRILDMETAEFIAEAVTSEEGKVEIGELPFGLYQVSVVAPESYLAAAGPLVFLDGANPTTSVNFALELAADTPQAQAAAGFLTSAIGLVTIAVAVTALTIAIWTTTKDGTP